MLFMLILDSFDNALRRFHFCFYITTLKPESGLIWHWHVCVSGAYSKRNKLVLLFLCSLDFVFFERCRPSLMKMNMNVYILLHQQINYSIIRQKSKSTKRICWCKKMYVYMQESSRKKKNNKQNRNITIITGSSLHERTSYMRTWINEMMGFCQYEKLK